MLTAVQQVDYVIVLCDDFVAMSAFYRRILPFPIATEREDVLALNAGAVTLCVRKRTRPYDGCSLPAPDKAAGPDPMKRPGVQVAFRVARGEVDRGFEELQRQGVTIVDPPRDQFWGHRTLFFADPEGNLLEIYEETRLD